MSETLSPQDQATLDAMRKGDAGVIAPAPATPEPAAPRPEPQPQPTLMPGTGDDPPPGQADPQDGTGRLSQALREERDRRRKSEAARHEIETRHAAEKAKLEERLNLLTQAADIHMQAQQPKPQPIEIPDINADPVGHITATMARQQQAYERELADMRKQMETVQGYTKEQQEQAQRVQQGQNIDRWVQQKEAEFASTVPDYTTAMQHLMTMRSQELALQGITDQHQVQEAIHNEVRQMAGWAHQQGRNIGEMLYSVAKIRGYAPQAAQQQQAPVVDQQPAQNFARQARGHEMAQTVGSVGGAPRGNSSVQALASMDESEFAAVLAKAQKGGPAALKQMLGG